MSFLDMNLGADIKDPEAAPSGRYTMLVDKAELVEGKTAGTMNVRCRVLFENMPEYGAVFHYLPLPNAEDDEEKSRNKSLMTKRFLVAFGVEFDEKGFDLASLSGARAEDIEVDVEEYQGRLTNRLKLPALSN